VLYNKGMEKLDKEIDIVEMVKNFRKLDTIIKFLLKKDQQLLLDLKNTIYISSDEESERYVLGLGKKKIIKKHKLLQRYIDNIKSKELNETDIKLLHLLGFDEVIDLLTKPAELAKINSEWVDVYPTLGRISSLNKKRSGSPKKEEIRSPRNKSNRRQLTAERRVKFDNMSLDDINDPPPEKHVFRSVKALERLKKK